MPLPGKKMLASDVLPNLSPSVPAKPNQCAILATREDKIKPVEKRSAEDKIKRDERLAFCLAVDSEIRKGTQVDAAIRLVTASLGGRMKFLPTAGKHGCSALTRQNYYSWMRKLGRTPDGLPDQSNADMLMDQYSGGVPQERPGAPMFWFLLQNYYLKENRLSFSYAYRNAKEDFQTKFHASNDEIPSKRTALYYLKKEIPAAVEIYGREGERGYDLKAASYVERDWSNIEVNDVWFADNRKFDLPIRVYDCETGKWIPRRPVVCAFSDARSGFFVGLRIAYEGQDHELIINTLGEAINLYGLPKIIYTDNGKDFRKRGFTTPIQYEAGGRSFSILGELGIELKRANAYNAKAKLIERDFQFTAKWFDKMFPEYLGNRPEQRPEIAALAYKPENVMRLFSLYEFSEMFAGWMTVYHSTPQPGSKNRQGLSPEEIFKHVTPRNPWSAQELKMAFLMPFERLVKVTRGAGVFVGGVSWYGENLWKYLGKQVIIKRDLADKSHIFAFTLNGALIGECRRRVPVAAIAASEEEKARLAAELERQRGEKKQVSQMFRQLCGAAAPLSPLEIKMLTSAQIEQAATGRLQLVKTAEVKSVKGAHHTAARYALPSGNESAYRAAQRSPISTEEETNREKMRRAIREVIVDETEQPAASEQPDLSVLNNQEVQNDQQQSVKIPFDI